MTSPDSYDETQLLAERNKHEAWLRTQPGVTGIGIGARKDGTPCIRVFTSSTISAQTKNSISKVLGSLPYDFEESGDFTAF